MKTIASVLVALSVFTGIAASIVPANAAERTLAQQLESEGRFGHNI